MSVLAPGRNIVLVGLMGAGKTTVGRLLAERLQRPFVDTDDMVEREADATVTEIFTRDGERRFRALESEMVRAVAALRGQVVAVGGGAVTVPANVTQLRATGDIVWLDADPTELAGRLGDDAVAARPLLADTDPVERLAALRAERLPAYRTAAAHRIDTAGRAPTEIAEEVLVWAGQRHGLLTSEELT